MTDHPAVRGLPGALAWMPYEPDEEPEGWKDLLWTFHTFAWCAAGKECGKWYEGTRWTYSLTAEQARSGNAYPGTVAVVDGDVPPPMANGHFLQAFNRWTKQNRYKVCGKP